MAVKILVCVITHSRPVGLSNLLDSLQKQVVSDDLHIEIGVVDNDCTGNNDAIVEKYRNKPHKIHFIKEPNRGIVHARNAGVNVFLSDNYEALAFIDDDEIAQPDWLQNLLNAQQKTSADIVTGDVLTTPEDGTITWTTKAMGRFPNKDYLSGITKFYTGNLLITRHVLETINPAFDIRFALTGSEDLHFALRCQKAGYKAIYTANAVVYETFPKTRANLKWFIRRGYRNGSGAARASLFISKTTITYIKNIALAFVRFGRGLLTLVSGTVRADKGCIALGLSRCASGIGTIAGLFDLTYEEYNIIHGK